MTLLSLALDIVLIGLLGTMIFFAVRLHRRLEVLRSGKQDLEVLLRDLVASTATAERNLKELQGMAEELAPTLQKQIAGARAAREELEFLLSSADVAADRLMNHIGASKTTANQVANRNLAAVDKEISISAEPRASNSQAAAVQSIQLRESSSAQADDTRRIAETDLLRAIEKLR